MKIEEDLEDIKPLIFPKEELETDNYYETPPLEKASRRVCILGQDDKKSITVVESSELFNNSSELPSAPTVKQNNTKITIKKIRIVKVYPPSYKKVNEKTDGTNDKEYLKVYDLNTDCVLFCINCKQDLVHLEITNQHIERYHKDEAPILYCKKCQKIVSNIADHFRTTDFLCKLCNKTFSNDASLRNHEKLYHVPLEIENKEAILKEKQKENSVALQRCYLCNFYFKNDIFCKNHLPCYTSAMNFDRLFAYFDMICESLKSEVNVFETALAHMDCFFSCVYCNKEFRETSALVIHLEVLHPNLESCGHCIKCNEVCINFQSHLHIEDKALYIGYAKTSDKQELLNVYFNLILSNKNYYFNCMHCNRKFSSTKSILSHHSRAHGKKPLKYKCLGCFLEFISPLDEIRNLEHFNSCSIVTSSKCSRCGELILMKIERMKHQNTCHINL